jgi:hypothetical protein
MTMTSTMEGTARIVGDTVWNGQPAKLIEIRADYTLEGTGMPVGSPSELEMVLSGPGTTRAVWDAQRGVLLSATSHGNATGTVSLVGMDITMAVMALRLWARRIQITEMGARYFTWAPSPRLEGSFRSEAST